MKNVKKVLCVLVLGLMLNHLAVAQSEDYFSKKHQIGLSNFNSLFKDNTAGEDDYMALPGLSYKFNKEKFGLRFSAYFNVDNNTYSDSTQNSYSNKEENENTMMLFNLGFELHSNFNRVQLFYGLDLFLSSLKTTEMIQDFYGDGDWMKEESKVTHSGYGVSPLVGVTFFITPYLSLSTETKFFIEMYEQEYYAKESEYWYSTYDESITEGTNTGTDCRFGPFGQISINVHF